jgi:hypothetical protein
MTEETPEQFGERLARESSAAICQRLTRSMHIIDAVRTATRAEAEPPRPVRPKLRVIEGGRHG